MVKKHDLKVKVIGSADNATGTTVINDNLSLSRAAFISKELQTRGVDSDVILQESKGGIDSYTPVPANRQVLVCLYMK